MDIHKVIGKIPFKPKTGFVLPTHRFTGTFNPLHLQLDSKVTHYLETKRIMMLAVYPCIMTFAIEVIHRLVNMNLTVKC